MGNIVNRLIVAGIGSFSISLYFLEASLVSAASFNFKYTFDSGEMLSGMVDGDLDVDKNKINNPRNVMAVYSGVDDIIFDIANSGDMLSLDGSIMNFGVFWSGSNPANTDLAVLSTSRSSFVTIDDVTLESDDFFDSSRWQISQKSVPEPSSQFTLLALGLLGAASTFKRKLKPSKSSEKETTKVG